MKVRIAGGNFGALPVGYAASAAISLSFTFDDGGSIATPSVLTLGAPNLDFADAGTGTCTTNGPSHTYNPGDTCTVDVTFNPKRAGPRYGGVTLTDGSGAFVANAYVSGVGAGPQISFSPAAQSSLFSGVLTSSLAVDGSGNVFVADQISNKVFEFLAQGGYTTFNALGGGFTSPVGVAVDGNGNVFVADSGAGQVDEILAVGGYTTANPLPANFGSPLSVAVDGFGNVFVADTGAGEVYEILAASGYNIVNLLGNGNFSFQNPTGLAVDGNGNVFVADQGANQVYEIPAADGYNTAYALANAFILTLPTGVAVDGAGNVFVTEWGMGNVYEIPAAGGYNAVNTVATGFSNPYGVTVDGSGNVFIAEFNHDVTKLDFVDPPSLSFTGTTAVGSTSLSPLTVTLQNSGNLPLLFPVPASGLNPSLTTGFTVDSSSTCPQLTPSSTAASLAVGASCAYVVDFSPVAAGPVNGSLTATDNALAPRFTTQSIALSGTAIGPPNISFTVPNHTYGDANFTVSATSNSSGAFTYSVQSGPATISGSTVHLTGAGTVVLNVAQAASSSFAAGTSSATFTVAAASPTITFTVSNKTYGVAPFTVSATSNSSGTLSYSVVSGKAAISGQTVTITGTGTVVLQASQLASGNYAAASKTATFTVAAGAPTISFTVANQIYGVSPFAVSATSNSAGALTYSVVSGPATILNGSVTLTGTGTVVLQASQAASGNYAAATHNATFTVAAGAPTITFTVPNHTFGDAAFSVSATSNSAGALTYSVVSGPATVVGTNVTLTGTGTVVLQASQAASGNYASATQNATFTVGGFSTQSVNMGSLPIATATPATTSLTFVFAAGGTIAAPTVLTMGASNLDFTDAGTGTCTTKGTSHSYNPGDTCTIAVTFTPKFAGLRYGGVTLTSSSGALIGSAYVYGAGTGPQVSYSPAVQTTLHGGFFAPWSVAEDGNGNVFVADTYNSEVGEIPAAGGYVTLTGDFSYPFGVAVDGNGNVFVADSSHGVVKKILAAGGYTTVLTLPGTFQFPWGVAVDGNGNVFVADNGNGPGTYKVYEMVAAGGYAKVTLASSFAFSGPTGIAVDMNGNVFVGDKGTHPAVYEILAAGNYTTVNTLASTGNFPGFSSPTGVALDVNANVFVTDLAADGNTSALYEILAAGGYTTVNTLAGSWVLPLGVSVDGDGNLLIADAAPAIRGPVLLLNSILLILRS